MFFFHFSNLKIKTWSDCFSGSNGYDH